MDTTTSAQALRREAIRRRLQGERRSDICRELQRSRRWFSKWWTEYRRNPRTDFADRARAPATSPQRLPPHVAQAVVTVRHVFEAAATPQTRYGLIGHRAIRSELARLRIHPVPSLATIQRILAAAGLTQPRGVASEAAYYPGRWRGSSTPFTPPISSRATCTAARKSTTSIPSTITVMPSI